MPPRRPSPPPGVVHGGLLLQRGDTYAHDAYLWVLGRVAFGAGTGAATTLRGDARLDLHAGPNAMWVKASPDLRVHPAEIGDEVRIDAVSPS